MRFMSIVKSSEEHRMSAPPQALMNAVGKLGDELTRAGVMVGMGGMLPSSMGGFRVRQQGRKLAITDGPFTEAKELIGGFAIIDVADKAEAVELARRWMQIHADVLGPGYRGSGEVRQLFERPGA